MKIWKSGCKTGYCDVNAHINENYYLTGIGAGTRELEEWEDVTHSNGWWHYFAEG